MSRTISSLIKIGWSEADIISRAWKMKKAIKSVL